jgi:hypothetical protein
MVGIECRRSSNCAGCPTGSGKTYRAGRRAWRGGPYDGPLKRAGLAQRRDHYRVQLSGGGQRRVAWARVFALRITLRDGRIVADEARVPASLATSHD